MRIFPLSNWTELDVWRFIAEREIELPSLYFAHEREVFERDGMLMAVNPWLPLLDGETPFTATVRFRTIGDATCTAAVASEARTIDDVVAETAIARVTERGATRADDRISEAGMEDRKRKGYF
jgi:sulfate adenylyltransferase subunit 2